MSLSRRQPGQLGQPAQQSITHHFGNGFKGVIKDVRKTLNKAGRGFATDIGGPTGTQLWNSYKPAYQLGTNGRPSKRAKTVKTITNRGVPQKTSQIQNFSNQTMPRTRMSRRARRPMRRTASRSRRKSSRTGRRMGGLKSMIKKIAIDNSEPRRVVFGTLTSANGELGVQALSLLGITAFPVNQVLAQAPVQQTDQNIVTASWTGESYYIKGFRLTGQLSNLSTTYRVGVRMFVYYTDTTELVTPNAPTLEFYNPNTNSNTPFGNLPECFRTAPKFGRNVPYKMIYSKTWVLDRSALANGFDGTALDNVSDVASFDKYIRINKTIRTRIKSTVNQRGYRQYYVGYHWHKMDYDQGAPVVTDFLPNLVLNGILYFRDP